MLKRVVAGISKAPWRSHDTVCVLFASEVISSKIVASFAGFMAFNCVQSCGFCLPTLPLAQLWDAPAGYDFGSLSGGYTPQLPQRPQPWAWLEADAPRTLPPPIDVAEMAEHGVVPPGVKIEGGALVPAHEPFASDAQSAIVRTDQVKGPQAAIQQGAVQKRCLLRHGVLDLGRSRDLECERVLMHYVC